MKTTCLASVLILLLMGCSSKVKQPAENPDAAMKVIFETDMGNDVDDALALDMLYKYMDAGKIDLIGIMTNKESLYSSEFIDIMNTWYGYPGIPVGIVRQGADCENDATNYAKQVCLMNKENGEPLFGRSMKNYDQLPDAHLLYRKILAQQPDHSVTIISVGFSTNLGRLLETQADEFSPLTGKELVTQKVKLLCTMAGCFNNDKLNEYNIVKDIPAARKVFEEWPTQLVTSPFEVGIAILYPASSILNDFTWAPAHPAAEAYKSYQPMPYDRPTWDLTSVLYTVEGPSWFNVSPAGKIGVTDVGGTTFIPDSTAHQFYLTVDSLQAEKIKQHFIDLIKQQPLHFKPQ